MTLLDELRKAWESFGIFKKWVSRLFHHHNKKVGLYKNTDGRNEHTDYIAVAEFRSIVYMELKKRILAAVLTVWGKARIGEDRENNLKLLGSTFGMLNEILEPGSFERKEFFERARDAIVKGSEDYYVERLKGWNTDDCAAYFEWLDGFSDQEEEILTMLSKICDELAFIANAVRNSFCQLLLSNYKSVLVSSPIGLSHLISTNNYPTLKRIKRLYTQYRDDITIIYDCFRRHIAAVINERFAAYIKQINDEQDEKIVKKLKVVGLRIYPRVQDWSIS